LGFYLPSNPPTPRFFFTQEKLCLSHCLSLSYLHMNILLSSKIRSFCEGGKSRDSTARTGEFSPLLEDRMHSHSRQGQSSGCHMCKALISVLLLMIESLHPRSITPKAHYTIIPNPKYVRSSLSSSPIHHNSQPCSRRDLGIKMQSNAIWLDK